MNRDVPPKRHREPHSLSIYTYPIRHPRQIRLRIWEKRRTNMQVEDLWDDGDCFMV